MCEITEAKVVDDLTSCIATRENAKIPLEDLGFSVDSSNLSANQIHGKWRHVFCNSTKDIGKTNLVKHKIVLEDDTLLNNHITVYPSSMFEEVCQHIREMLDANVICEPDSPYASNKINVVLGRKPSGALCLLIGKS